MEIKVSIQNGRVPVTVVHLVGNLDSNGYPAFQSKADELIKEGTRFMLVDLSDVPFMSSAGLRALQNIFNQLRKIHPDENMKDEEMFKGIRAGTYKSPHLKLLGLSANVKHAFELSGFDTFLETFTDLNQAIAAF